MANARLCKGPDKPVKKPKVKKERPKRQLITGQRFGKLLVIQEIEKTFSGSGRYRVIVLCDCGTVKQMQKTNVINTYKSCGCGVKPARKRYARQYVSGRMRPPSSIRLRLPGGVSKVAGPKGWK